MNYEEKGLKEWKVIILIRMYKDSNFFFFSFDCWLLSFPSTLSLIPLVLSLSFSFSLSLALIRSLLLPHTHTHTQSSFFLSFLLAHPSIFSSFSFIQILYHTLPFPFFIHASISFIYTIAWPGTGSRSEGTSIVRLLLRHRYQICINDEIKSDLSNYE